VAAPRSIKRSATVDCPYQVGSQADSAGSIPVTRSTREKRCKTSKLCANPLWNQPLTALESGLRAINVPLAHVAGYPGTVLILIRAVVI
jgi:hypothetical protein